MRDIRFRRFGPLSAGFAVALALCGCAPSQNCQTTCAPEQRAHNQAATNGTPSAGESAASGQTAGSHSEAPATTASLVKSEAATAPPSLGELPNLKPLTKRSIAARVDVAGSEKIGKRRIVPDYSTLELSPEEKKALGKDKPPPPDDVLAFYKPSPNPDKGASIMDSDLRIGISGRGGAMIGQVAPPPKAYAFGQGGRYAEPGIVSREGASVYNERDRRWEVSFPWTVRIGEGPAREGAEVSPVDEPR